VKPFWKISKLRNNFPSKPIQKIDLSFDFRKIIIFFFSSLLQNESKIDTINIEAASLIIEE